MQQKCIGGQEMNQNDLYIEYARVIKMCKDTVLEDKPWLGVRFNGSEFYDHPRFDTLVENYQFAVAILEDRAVFVGDILYLKSSCWEYVADKYTTASAVSDMTWQPPKPKRTFILNGVELPCPLDGKYTEYSLIVSATPFYFKSGADRDDVRDNLLAILKSARNKP